MSTVDTVFLGIAAIALALFFVIATGAAIAAWVLVSKVKKVVQKAEEAIDSVEEATETIKNVGRHASGPFAAIKIIKSIIDIVGRR